MNLISIAFLALAMSIDAFVASISRGAAVQTPSWGTALRTGLVFGTVEAITPLLGWALGVAAWQFVQAVDHWVAFALLAGVGVRMCYLAVRSAPEDDTPRPVRGKRTMLLTAIGTSIDAMAVGVSLAFLPVNILLVALAIGAATFLMSSGGIMVGHLLGARFGRWAEFFAGLVLVGLGAMILMEHLSA